MILKTMQARELDKLTMIHFTTSLNMITRNFCLFRVYSGYLKGYGSGETLYS